ncbi:alpha/beta hydrolase [Serratia aquatilis]|uniref:Alpha/beta hydrolase n=1 Tax=Serratia aquatilis TaxID=1737515 RepID=A0ABV6EKF5_9GAMM
MKEIYRGMTRSQLDAAYNNTKAVENFTKLLEEFQFSSKKLYLEKKSQIDVCYHSSPRTTFDYFPASQKNCPTFIFIHGGYWQNCNKEDFAFIAEGILNAGINVILAEYTLAPEASMTQIVNEIGLLLDYLNQHTVELNITRGKVCLGGHSAGGHLTVIHRNHPLISHAMPISALIDLQPISLCWLNDKLSLSDNEIEKYSPINKLIKGGPIAVHVGGGELPELIRHSKELYHELKDIGSNVIYQEVGNHDHFTQLYEFTDPDGFLVKSLKELLAR